MSDAAEIVVARKRESVVISAGCVVQKLGEGIGVCEKTLAYRSCR